MTERTDNKATVYIPGHYRTEAADGLAEFNYLLTQALKADFTIQFIEFCLEQAPDWYQIEHTDDICIHKFGIKNCSKLQLPKAFQNWLKAIRGETCIFHLSHIYNIDNYLICRLLNKYNIPYLITPHDSFVYDPDFRKKRPFLKRLYRNAFIRVFDKYVLDNAAVVHGITAMCAGYLKNITNSPVCVVANQVSDTNILLNLAALKPQVCFIGRFSIFNKGIDLALKAFQVFKSSSGHAKEVKYTLIGPADAPAIVEREQLCRQLKLKIGEDVVFTGKLSEADRNTILAESKVYMQLSRSEGFGLSIAQALSCYKPVIISTQVPIHDKVTAYNAGFAVTSPEEAAQALDKIFSLSQTEYATMAENARRCYEQEFHPDVIKPQLIGLYEKALLHVRH
ncbi:glycosyltransferase family 4 protein [Hymenobacter wooponensis]|uniref:Glycosyltransferase n=1 Tax=Hymenobacter wooponensis TaxID=1525360 RepID=A0A4Z0MGV2_9BACT|nr:glycosyltransferase family 4 protein [Hymenobacter wooponensis]TGD78751.1 glycosyltransferase [Hymenobacter wooponensis]